MREIYLFSYESESITNNFAKSLKDVFGTSNVEESTETEERRWKTVQIEDKNRKLAPWA